MATPHVATAAALLLADVAEPDAAQLIKRWTATADRVAQAKKGSVAYGGGRLNVEKLLR